MKTSPRVHQNHFALCTAKRGKTQLSAKTAETLVEITPLFLPPLFLLLKLDFPLKTDMFDSCGAANVFAASVLFKMEKRRGEEKTLSSH